MDNHTHLPVRPGDYVCDSARVIKDIPLQLHQARQVGVAWQVASLCEAREIQAVIEGAAQFAAPDYDSLRWAVAIHPNDAARHAGCFEIGPDGVEQKPAPQYLQWDLEGAIGLVEAARQALGEKMVAVGESGLDYFRTAPGGRQAQQEAFRRHIALAKEWDLPLQIHDREAHQDCIDILLADGAPRRTVFHCYSGDSEMAQILAENGWYASFAGNVTYPANTDLQAAAQALPRHLVLVETDAPYLTPVPWRGHPNASYLLPHTVRFLAELWQVSEEEAAAILRENSQAVYGTW